MYLVPTTNKRVHRYILIDLSVWLFYIHSVVYKRFHQFRCTEKFSIEKTFSHIGSVLCHHSLPLLFSLNIYLKQGCIVCHVWLNLVKWFRRERGLRRQRKQRQRRTSSDSEELPCWYHLNARIFRLPLVHSLICSSSKLFSNYTSSKHFSVYSLILQLCVL